MENSRLLSIRSISAGTRVRETLQVPCSLYVHALEEIITKTEGGTQDSGRPAFVCSITKMKVLKNGQS